MANGYKFRKHNRFGASIAVLVREAGDFQWRHGRVSDISLGGLSALFEEPFAAETRVELEFYTVDVHGEPKRRRLRGVVMWARARKNGIRFDVGKSSEREKAAKGAPAKKKSPSKKR